MDPSPQENGSMSVDEPLQKMIGFRHLESDVTSEAGTSNVPYTWTKGTNLATNKNWRWVF